MARAGRICAWPRCTAVTPHGKARCTEHARQYEAQRGTTTQRGYGHTHRKLTKAALAGATHCANCGAKFTADNPATGGHVIPVRAGGTAADGIVAQCRRCNYGWRRTGL